MRKHAIAAVLVLLLGATLSHAAVIGLTPDTDRSTPSAFGGSVQGLIDDPFAYDPQSPTSPAPTQSVGGTAGFFHNNGHNPAIVALTFNETYDNVFLDLYGRDGFTDRDDNFTIEFYDGSWDAADLTQQISGFSIPGHPTYYARATAAPDTEADRFLLRSSHEFFTLMELRANGALLPEPASAALLLVAAGVFLTRVPRRGVA